MVVKAAMIVRAHFAHKAACTSPYQAHPESPEHRAGKYFIAERVREQLAPDYPNVAIDFEVPVPEANRVADVMVTFPNGWRIAHECQLASITAEQLGRRTEDYLRAGVDTVWWLGKSANTPANRNWCVEYLGFALEINFTLSVTDAVAA